MVYSAGILLEIIMTSKNPCYAQATWDWICLKKQIKTKIKAKQNKTKTNKQTNKQKIKNQGAYMNLPYNLKKISDKDYR